MNDKGMCLCPGKCLPVEKGASCLCLPVSCALHITAVRREIFLLHKVIQEIRKKKVRLTAIAFEMIK